VWPSVGVLGELPEQASTFNGSVTLKDTARSFTAEMPRRADCAAAQLEAHVEAKPRPDSHLAELSIRVLVEADTVIREGGVANLLQRERTAEEPRTVAAGMIVDNRLMSETLPQSPTKNERQAE
jgi:hypothetical protein